MRKHNLHRDPLNARRYVNRIDIPRQQGWILGLLTLHSDKLPYYRISHEELCRLAGYTHRTLKKYLQWLIDHSLVSVEECSSREEAVYTLHCIPKYITQEELASIQPDAPWRQIPLTECPRKPQPQAYETHGVSEALTT